MSQVFISYSSQDRQIVDELAADLSVLFEYDIWYDRQLNGFGGQNWWDIILNQINECEIFLFAVSLHSLQSEYCTKELQYALDLKKPVLPVKFSEIDKSLLSTTLKPLQIIDYIPHNRLKLRELANSLTGLSRLPKSSLPENKFQLRPTLPIDQISEIFEQIRLLEFDEKEQLYLIAKIEDLIESGEARNAADDLLTAYLNRTDVLIAKNEQRARKLLQKLEVSPAKLLGTHLTIQKESIAFSDRERIWKDAHGISMVYVPPGTFLMGSTETEVERSYQIARRIDPSFEREPSLREIPQHEQIVAEGFYLDLTPVTNKSYSEFVDAGGYNNPDYWTRLGWDWLVTRRRTHPDDYADLTAPEQPRVGINWFEAYAYCQWRGGRLPTELEWEWAARGPENRIYPWGNQFDGERITYRQNANGLSAPVGLRPEGASWVGALDMSGNVFEWTSTILRQYPYDANDGREEQLLDSSLRVLRGGSWWHNNPMFFRTSYRSGFDSHSQTRDYGFRCVITSSEHNKDTN